MMSDNSEQRRRHWPWRLGLVLLVVAAGVGIALLIRPGRIDPQLVGEWTYAELPDAGILLLADGSFIKTNKGQPLWKPRHALWSVQGKRIVVNYCHANAVNNLLVQLHELYSQATDGPVPMGLERFELLDVQPDAMRVRYVDIHSANAELTLRRRDGS